MSPKSDPDILRDLAALVMRRRLGGRTFPAAVAATAGRYGKPPPAAVREVARMIHDRHPDLLPAGVAAKLRQKANEVEAGTARNGRGA